MAPKVWGNDRLSALHQFGGARVKSGHLEDQIAAYVDAGGRFAALHRHRLQALN